MKTYKVKEFKAYQSVKFGKHQVNHFYLNKNNPVKMYLKDIEIYYVIDLNCMMVKGSAGEVLVNMSNVSEWVLSDMTCIFPNKEKVIKERIIKDKVKR